jgi:DNA-binding PadR family transcriptional regulator
MGKKVYALNDEQKKQFAGAYLLNVMINTPRSFPVLLEGNEEDLEPVLEWLLMKEYIEIRNQERYVPNEKGREVLKRFLARYTEYLKVFDIYCAVDLQAGEFAFASYLDFEDNASWKNFLNDDRWDDIRLAVAEFKKLDPVEIAFMSFLNEDRFGRDETGWQFDLLLGSIWDEIILICNTAIRWEDLGYEDEKGSVSAKDVITDIIKQGSALMIKLLEREEKLRKEQPEESEDFDDDNGEDHVVEKVVVEAQPINYYYSYYDPFYVSPLWLAVWLL